MSGQQVDAAKLLGIHSRHWDAGTILKLEH